MENLRGHEGKLIIDTTLDDLGVDDETGGNIVCMKMLIKYSPEYATDEIHTQKDQTGVSRQVELRNADTTDSTVVLQISKLISKVSFRGIKDNTYQGPLEPLGRVGVQSILGEVLEVASKRAQTLRAHRVTLVSLLIFSCCQCDQSAAY